MPTADSWYCNGSFLSGWLGCPSGVLTSQQQLDAMKGNFGANSDPSLVDSAVNDFSLYLQNSGYDSTVNNLTCQDSLLGCSPFGNIPWSTIIGVVGIGMFALVTIGGGSPRRYGR